MNPLAEDRLDGVVPALPQWGSLMKIVGELFHIYFFFYFTPCTFFLIVFSTTVSPKLPSLLGISLHRNVRLLLDIPLIYMPDKYWVMIEKLKLILHRFLDNFYSILSRHIGKDYSQTTHEMYKLSEIEMIRIKVIGGWFFFIWSTSYIGVQAHYYRLPV